MAENACCNEEQRSFALLYSAYLCAVFWLLECWLLKPLRLTAVFLHEFSHATACWLTGGSVHAIEVNEREGGVTRYVGGCLCCIAPAGYLGCSFCGAIFVVASGGRITATVTAVGYTLALLIALCFRPNRLTVFLNITYALLTTAIIVVEWFYFSPLLGYITLFYGVFIGVFGNHAIVTDLILRTVPGSDAYALYEEARCCLPKCIGVQWLLLSLFFQVVAFWFALVLMSDHCSEEGWFQCVFSDAPFVPFFSGLFQSLRFDF